MAASPDDIQTRDRWGALDDQGIDDMGPVKLDHDTVMDDLPSAMAAEDPSALANSNGEDVATSSLRPRDDVGRDRPPKVLSSSLVFSFRLSCVTVFARHVVCLWRYLPLLGHSSLPHGWMLDICLAPMVPVVLTVARLGRHCSTSTTGLVYFASHDSSSVFLVLNSCLRLAQPNKVYIGGLPENTRPEDLRNGFGKLGNIINIELKTGYGFVEFDNRRSAEESVAKYHEGYFMGNKDPGACFKCGENGHWAKECSRQTTHSRSGAATESTLLDRLHPREYPTPRDYTVYRDEPGRYPPRESRYYDSSPPPSRDYRRPPSPPRDDRAYPAPTPRSSRYDRDSYTSKNLAAPSRAHDRYDRRPVDDRYEPPHSGRPRTPPGPPPNRRDYDRPPRYATTDSWDLRTPVIDALRSGYEQERVEHGRPMTPPRPMDYPRSRSVETVRYRRRSVSPRSSRYEPGSYSNSSSYSGNGYTSDRHSASLRDSGRSRDYYNNGRDSDHSYRRL
ncbi:hypothetical protein EDC04DRAFT_2906150 [Pisolithus marmoratus]|nr:hypothetical protein EDC04DRAFT_2906150 [Pisolithus marmoratus]